MSTPDEFDFAEIKVSEANRNKWKTQMQQICQRKIWLEYSQLNSQAPGEEVIAVLSRSVISGFVS